MEELLFVTNNQHKLVEIRAIMSSSYKLLSLEDIGFRGEIPETGFTLESNAEEKACYIYNRYKLNCFADDTGLEIDALDGRPGYLSARYAGTACNPVDNMKKVLSKLSGIKNRRAQFRTVIALVCKGKVFHFEGKVKGEIALQPRGKLGFGYDPIFIPHGFSKTFAEMKPEYKNAISHRSMAMKKLADFLHDFSLLA